MNGKKTYIGIGLWLIATVISRFLPEYADALQPIADVGLGLAGIGAAHKLAKSEVRSFPANVDEPEVSSSDGLSFGEEVESEV